MARQKKRTQRSIYTFPINKEATLLVMRSIKSCKNLEQLLTVKQWVDNITTDEEYRYLVGKLLDAREKELVKDSLGDSAPSYGGRIH